MPGTIVATRGATINGQAPTGLVMRVPLSRSDPVVPSRGPLVREMLYLPVKSSLPMGEEPTPPRGSYLYSQSGPPSPRHPPPLRVTDHLSVPHSLGTG